MATTAPQVTRASKNGRTASENNSSNNAEIKERLKIREIAEKCFDLLQVYTTKGAELLASILH